MCLCVGERKRKEESGGGRALKGREVNYSGGALGKRKERAITGRRGRSTRAEMKKT